MNSTSTNADGWGASLMRKNLNSTSVVNGMINLSDIESVVGSNIIKSVTKSYIKKYNDKNSVTQCNDKLVKDKINNSNYVLWWLRSPYYTSNVYFCYVYNNGSIQFYNTASTSYGVAPGFAI